MGGGDMKPKKYRIFHTIQGRILLITISLIVLISTVITIISFQIVSSSLRQNLIQTSETRLSFLSSSIDSNINNVQTFIRACQKSSKVTEFVMQEETDDNRIKRETHDLITETYSANAMLPSQLVRMVIIGNRRSDIIQVVESPYSTTAISKDAILSLPYYEELHLKSGKDAAGIMVDPFLSTKKVLMIPYIHPIQHPYQADEIGCIFTEVSLSVITKPMENYLTETDGRYFFQVGDDWYQYADNMLTASEEEYELLEDLSEEALSRDTCVYKYRNPEDGGTFIMITRPLEASDWYVSEALDESVLSRNIFRTFFLIVLIIVLASAFIGILLSWFLSNTVNVPVKKLQTRMKRIAEGDFRRDPDTEWDHELGDIGKNINDLSENVSKLMEQRIEDERQRRDYEYKMLQSQINPHFLYNTLNSIKWMATIQNAPGIAEMTTALSHLLKDISKGTTNLVALSHEIALLNDYFTIQQYRYGGTIALNWRIDKEELTSCCILKFTLQPIVENAIFHGIEPKGSSGTIDIHIYQNENKDICIDILDDGIGMEPEVAARLLDQDTAPGSSFFREIGISNVHKRLQYEFGKKYGLRISSKTGRFTLVSILLPFIQISDQAGADRQGGIND